MLNPTKVDHLKGIAVGNQALKLNGTNPFATHPLNVRQWDILCGKNRKCVDHDGSRRFRAVIECHRKQYQQALTKFDKTNVTRTIYDILSQSGSRFLRHDDTLDVWEEISPMAARDKIGHALRFANRVSRQQHQTNYGSMVVAAKPAAAILPTQSFSSTFPAQPSGAPLQPLRELCAPNSTRTSYVGLEHATKPMMLVSSFAPSIHVSDVQTATPVTLVECATQSTCMQHDMQKKETSIVFQKMAPSCVTDSRYISILNSAFITSMNGTNTSCHYNAKGFDAFEQGCSSADWDFDAEILSVLL